MFLIFRYNKNNILVNDVTSFQSSKISCSSRRFDILYVVARRKFARSIGLYCSCCDQIVRILFVLEFYLLCLLFHTFTHFNLVIYRLTLKSIYFTNCTYYLVSHYWKFDVWDNSGNWDELYSVMSIGILVVARKMIPCLKLSRGLTSSKFCFLIRLQRLLT